MTVLVNLSSLAIWSGICFISGAVVGIILFSRRS